MYLKKISMFSLSKMGNTCKEAEENGIYILHANGIQFHKSTFDYEPPFNAIYETIKNVSRRPISIMDKPLSRARPLIDTYCFNFYSN